MTNDINAIANKLAAGLSLDDMRRRQADFANRQAPAIQKTPEQAEKEAEYWKTVFAEKPKRPDVLFVCRPVAQEMDFVEAKRELWYMMQVRQEEIRLLDNNPEFVWVLDNNLPFILSNLVKYFINDCTCKWPLTKGLFAYGNTGTGKSEIFRVMAAFTKKYNLSKAFTFTEMTDVFNKARQDKSYDPIEINQQHDRCLDEFGRNVGPVLRFGEPLEINESVIEARYNRFKRYGQITHIIANMVPNETGSMFSPVVFDRLRSMCTSIEFQGQSKR